MTKYEQIISEVPHAKIYVRDNIDYSMSKVKGDGFIAEAVDVNDDSVSGEQHFETLDEIYKHATSHNFLNEIIISVLN